jgi:hypothetical protein
MPISPKAQATNDEYQSLIDEKDASIQQLKDANTELTQ